MMAAMKILAVASALHGAATAMLNEDVNAQVVIDSSSSAATNGKAKLASLSGPVLHHNFPDPHIVKEGGYWWAFATNNPPKTRPYVQVATSLDFKDWTLMSFDPLMGTGKWSAGNATRSPSVLQRSDGKWMLFYTNPLIVAPDLHCIGTALADRVAGPYMTNAELPFICDVDHGGAIDPAAIRDADGTPYLVYKVDGNRPGCCGGARSNSMPLRAPKTPIMLQQLSDDLNGTLGNAVPLLTNDEGDDGLNIESPSLIRSASGIYYLFYSSGCFETPEYSVKYATASSIKGPYTRQGALIETGTRPGLAAPGSATIDVDGKHMVFHADCAEERCLFTAEVALK